MTRRKRIKPVSDKLAAAKRAYNDRVKVWLKGKRCAVYNQLRATQVHHQRGRVGRLLMDERFWIPVSESAHALIHSNMEWARQTDALLCGGDTRELKLLCARGQWNTVPKL